MQPLSSLSSAKKKLEAEWEMCRREYDARIALMMLMEGRAGSNSATSTTGTVDQSRPPAQFMKLLGDASDHHSGSGLLRSRTDGWHFLAEYPNRPQVHKLTM